MQRIKGTHIAGFCAVARLHFSSLLVSLLSQTGFGLCLRQCTVSSRCSDVYCMTTFSSIPKCHVLSTWLMCLRLVVSSLGVFMLRYSSLVPRYTPLTLAYSVTPATLPRYVPVPDTNNILSRPSGPQYALFLSEGRSTQKPLHSTVTITHCVIPGVYVLRDDLQLGSIPPHPSDNLVTNPNVLDPKPVPPTAGTRLSLATLAPRRLPCYLPCTPIKNTLGSLVPLNTREIPHESSQSVGEHETNSWTSRATGNFRAFAFGESNTALTPTNAKESKDQLKRKKPKNNINKSSSSFVSRVILHDAFNKHIQDHNPQGLFAFANINRALLWLDLSSSNKVCNGLPLLRSLL